VASIVVCGGSIIGLSTAMLLARDGHDVTVLERDAAPNPDVPAQAWETWERKGVPQFHQPHNLFSRFRVILDAEIPELVDRLVEAGCVWMNPIANLPPFVEDHDARPGDDRFPYVTGRRPVIEATLAKAAAEHEGVTVQRGVGVAELVTGPAVADGAPHVVGVRTANGEELRAALVVDATGRRTQLADLLVAIGAREPYVETEESGILYKTR
jgi:2-polyprenyl-6-methoxyphenol hydroxylase-like FAD-dependent oxidoreductase